MTPREELPPVPAAPPRALTPCNGGRSVAEWWRCDRLLILTALMFILIAMSPHVTAWWLRTWIAGGAVAVVSRRLFGLRRYWAQLWASTVAVSVSASLALTGERYGLALGFLLIAALTTTELRH